MVTEAEIEDKKKLKKISEKLRIFREWLYSGSSRYFQHTTTCSYDGTDRLLQGELFLFLQTFKF